ncbi:hypothetical protein [Phaeobacter italicus]|jgi:hypothetical protein|uniref:hypothetical protein n=1 Tax=Phaeobacter italicus TaxID=481446 RepID=UPI002FDE336C
MITLDEIEAAVRAQRGSWQAMFRRQGAGWHCILFPRRILTNAEHQELARRLSKPDGGAALSPAERQRNKLRALADASDVGGRRYGR